MEVTNVAAEVELIECMGTDLTVVNAARVSFGTRKSTLDDADVPQVNVDPQNSILSATCGR